MDEIITSADVSKNRVWGILGTTSVADVLDSCRRGRVTGEVTFRAGHAVGIVELRAGCVERAELEGKTGDAALAALRTLCNGTFEVVQRLPDLCGTLGSSAEFHGEVSDVPLIAVMRHVEEHALSVTLTIIHEFDRGVVRYRDGDIIEVELNGDRDLDRIGDILRFPAGKYRVMSAPLALPLPVRPAPRRLPTEPFQVGHIARMTTDDSLADQRTPRVAAPISARCIPIAPAQGTTLAPSIEDKPAWLESRVGRMVEPRLRDLHRRARRAIDGFGRFLGD